MKTLSGSSLWLILFCLLISSAPNAKDVLHPPVTVEPVKEKSFEDATKEVGKIQAIDSVDLSFNASAKLTAIYFKNGDLVKQGDLIAQLDSVKAKADVDKARSTLALARTKLERVTNLLAKQPDALSKQDVDELKENVQLATADFKQKKATLGDYRLIAPFNGQLTSFSLSVGAQVSADTPLVTLYRLDPVEVHYALGQTEFGKAQPDQKVFLTVDAYKGREFKGVVSYVAPAVDASSGRVEIHAKLNNPDHALAPGMFANVKQIFGKGIIHLLVPQNSVIAKNKKRYVWVLQGNKVSKRAVTLGKNTNDGYVIIKSGLAKSDTVVKTGMQNLKEGEEVRVLTSEQPATEPTTDPVTEPTAAPVTKPTTDPATEPTADPVTEPTAAPVTEPTADPATEPTTDPVTEPTADPATEPTTDPVTKPTTDPATKPTTEKGKK
ncbi:MAG: efflux RND transporter periplasmic adaptor subunit [Shewanella sp.]|nr:efflux RND transporter periplasmic adaptor subunit [Shewanella sp.]